MYPGVTYDVHTLTTWSMYRSASSSESIRFKILPTAVRFRDENLTNATEPVPSGTAEGNNYLTSSSRRKLE